MSMHRFEYVNNFGVKDDQSDHLDLAVQYDDKNGGNIENVINAFVQYLWGLGYTQASVSKYIKTAYTE
jgi:hypothetical protein